LAFTRFRPLFGPLSGEVEEAVREFLFSQDLNGETLSEIFSMRERLEKELGRKEPLKYGAGGVVDLEFVAYTYQLYSKKWLRNTYLALSELAEEEERFKELPNLYRLLREAETEKRLFGQLIKYSDRITALRERVRSLYREFVQWISGQI
jgi:glutamate-ammonia-ligase adenylyltransferase